MNGKNGRLTALAVMIALMTAPAWAQNPIVRLGDAVTTAVVKVEVAELSSDRAVTAAIVQGTNGLELTSWKIAGDGEVTIQGLAAAGAVADVAVTTLGGSWVVTAVRQTNNLLKVIVWSIAGNGVMTRMGDYLAGGVLEVEAAALDSSHFATAVRQTDGQVKVVAWQVTSAGAVVRLGDSIAGTGDKVSLSRFGPRLYLAYRDNATNLRFHRYVIDGGGVLTQTATGTAGSVSDLRIVGVDHDHAVTVVRNQNGLLELVAWRNVSGAFTRLGEYVAGEISELAVDSLANGRLATAVRDGGGNLKLVWWQLDKDEVIRRLGDAQAWTVTKVALASLADRRLLSAVRLADGTLKLVAWDPHRVELLRAEWSVAGGGVPKAAILETPAPSRGHRPMVERPPLATSAEVFNPMFKEGMFNQGVFNKGLPSPALANPQPFVPEINNNRWDPMIAAGHQFLVISQDHQVGFFNKQGNVLTDAAGNALRYSSNQLFNVFTRNLLPDGSLNPVNINRNLGFPAVPSMPCDPTLVAQPSPTSCINELYDTRVVYDDDSHRFVILSAARNQVWFNDPNNPGGQLDDVVRRYFALAVSKTEDPRDGFFMYMSTSSNYSDWPWATVSEGQLLVAHNSKEATNDGIKPVLYAFRLADFSSGSELPAQVTVFPDDTGYYNLRPVTMESEANNHILLLARRARAYGVEVGNFARLYFYFSGFDLSLQLPTLQSSSVALNPPLHMAAAPVYRNSMLHSVGPELVSAKVCNGDPARYRIRLRRLPVLFSVAGSGSPSLSTNPSLGFRDTALGCNLATDAPGDKVSCDNPVLAVTGGGDIVVGFGRLGVDTASPLFPESAYLVWYAGESTPRDPARLFAGEYLPAFAQCVSACGTDGSGAPLCETQATTVERNLDYATAVIDPADESTAWIAHTFADSSWNAMSRPYNLVVGAVEP